MWRKLGGFPVINKTQPELGFDDGYYTIIATASDRAGNTLQNPASFSVDIRAPPLVEILDPPPNGGISLAHERRLGICVAVNGDGRNTHLMGGSEYTSRDLATVGDQNASDGGHGHYIRKTPKPRRPCTGLLWATDSDMPSTVRVSRGSMMPSS